MMTKHIIILTLLASLPLPVQAATEPTCGTVKERHFASLKHLPRGAVQAMTGRMADTGEAFQSTDVILGNLPSRRFMSAVQRGCTLTIAYEQGGIALFHGTIVLRRGGSGWTLITDRRQGEGKTFPPP